MTLVSPSKVEHAPISQAQWGTYSGYSSVVGHFGNVNLTPSPVACPEQSRRAPATGCFCRPSTRRLVLSEAEGRVPAYRRQAAGLSGKGNVVKLTHYLLVHMIGDTFRKKRPFRHPRNSCRRGELGGYYYRKARQAVRREEGTLRRRKKNRSRAVPARRQASRIATSSNSTRSTPRPTSSPAPPSRNWSAPSRATSWRRRN